MRRARPESLAVPILVPLMELLDAKVANKSSVVLVETLAVFTFITSYMDRTVA